MYYYRLQINWVFLQKKILKSGVTITILVIIHSPAYHVVHNVSETEMSPPSGGTYSAEPNRWNYMSGGRILSPKRRNLNKRQCDG
jgi:hypothetical protein